MSDIDLVVEVDVERFRGDTFADQPQYIDAYTGLPLVITGCTFIRTVTSVKNPTDSSSFLFSMTGVIVDDETGEVSYAPTAPNVATAGKFFYDDQMTDEAGRIKTLAKGRYTIKQDNTK